MPPVSTDRTSTPLACENVGEPVGHLGAVPYPQRAQGQPALERHGGAPECPAGSSRSVLAGARRLRAFCALVPKAAKPAGPVGPEGGALLEDPHAGAHLRGFHRGRGAGDARADDRPRRSRWSPRWRIPGWGRGRSRRASRARSGSCHFAFHLRVELRAGWRPGWRTPGHRAGTGPAPLLRGCACPGAASARASCRRSGSPPRSGCAPRCPRRSCGPDGRTPPADRGRPWDRPRRAP